MPCFCDACLVSEVVIVNPFLDLGSARDVQKMRSLATDLYEEVFLLGGTISGEHGCGLSRTQFVRQQYGELVDVFEKIKRIFDPENLLNPGKITGGDPHQLTRQLRPVVSLPEISAGLAAGAEIKATFARAFVANLKQLKLREPSDSGRYRKLVYRFGCGR